MSATSTYTGATTDPPAKATYQDVIDAPAHLTAEIIEGQLYLSPYLPVRQNRAWSALMMKLFSLFDLEDDPGGWMIFNKPELHLCEEVIVPDIAGWRRPWKNYDPDSCYTTNVPAWVCEVLAPATRPIDLGPKRRIYADHGVGHLWFLDPAAQTLDAYVLKDGDWTSVGSALNRDMVCLPPFEAISFSLGDLWRW